MNDWKDISPKGSGRASVPNHDGRWEIQVPRLICLIENFQVCDFMSQFYYAPGLSLIYGLLTLENTPNARESQSAKKLK
jgi:hypothetical protein